MDTGKQFLAYVQIALAMGIVGSYVVAGKLIVQSFPVFLVSEFRFLIASIILVPLLIKLEGIPSLNKKDVMILLLQSLSGVFLFSILMLYGLKFTTALEGGLLTSTLPAVVGIIAFFILKEKPTSSTIAGILLAVTGTIFIQLSGAAGIERGPSPLLGNMLIIGAVICEALFMILGKSVAARISPLAISTVVSVIGALLFLPFSLYELKVTEYHLSSTSLAEWGLVAYLGVVVTVLAFLLMYQALSKLPAGKAGVMTSVLPVSSVILSVAILDEAFSVYHLAGLLFILLAIGFVSKDSAEREGRKITG